MKALVIDCACSRMTVAAKNEDKTFTAIYDIGMRQSETLVPAMDYVTRIDKESGMITKVYADGRVEYVLD